MDFTPKSKKPMTKDEVAMFIDLVASFKILTSKETNAATNKLKEDAWHSLTAAFNAKCGSVPKQKDQLKLKWDNLKKAARKRSQQIRMNQLKTGGGKPEFIPPDELLEKVSNILGVTCSGFEVPFGGDGTGTILELEVVPEGELQEHLTRDNVVAMQLQDNNIVPSTSGAKIKTSNLCDIEGSNGSHLGAKLYGMPTMAKSLQNKGKKKRIEDGRLERNQAIAEYYKKKTAKIDIEIKLLKLELDSKINKENNLPKL